MRQDETSFFSKPASDANGTRRWYKEDTLILHRLGGGPAVVRTDGTQEWWENGKRHRIDGPAFIGADSSKLWCVNGNLHRLDGDPAVERADGSREWWKNGKRHRVGGPAVEEVGGEKQWWENGQCHRLDGPAIEYAGGEKQWWVNHVQVDGSTFELFEQAISKTTPSSELSTLSRHENSVVAEAAARNPNCPIEDQIEWVLSPQR